MVALACAPTYAAFNPIGHALAHAVTGVCIVPQHSAEFDGAP
jgi:hypothetical protein